MTKANSLRMKLETTTTVTCSVATELVTTSDQRRVNAVLE